MAEGNGSEDRVTERMVLERARVLVIPDGVKEDELLAALKDLTGSRRGFRIDLAWLERGIFKGTGKRQTIEVYAGKAGTPDAKVGTFKAPSVTSWKGGLVMEAPPKPLVQASLLEGLTVLDSVTTVIVGGRRLRLSRHAVERYAERVKPMFDYGAARLELATLLRGCELVGEQPAWAVGRRDDPCGWIVLTDGIAFPVVDNEIVTCLTRAEVGAELRIVRESRGDRERRSRKRRKQHGKVARDERRRARARREASPD